MIKTNRFVIVLVFLVLSWVISKIAFLILPGLVNGIIAGIFPLIVSGLIVVKFFRIATVENASAPNRTPSLLLGDIVALLWILLAIFGFAIGSASHDNGASGAGFLVLVMAPSFVWFAYSVYRSYKNKHP